MDTKYKGNFEHASLSKGYLWHVGDFGDYSSPDQYPLVCHENCKLYLVAVGLFSELPGLLTRPFFTRFKVWF